MEYFNEVVRVITEALNSSLRKRKLNGEFVINIHRTKGTFNIWTYKIELLWIVNPMAFISVCTLQDNRSVPNGKEQAVKEELLTTFIQQLFEKQEDIWNLISTSQD